MRTKEMSLKQFLKGQDKKNRYEFLLLAAKKFIESDFSDEKAIPANMGLEGALEYIEGNIDHSIIRCYIDNDDLVGFELIFNIKCD